MPERVLTRDAFHWWSDEVEDIGRYRPGGYHPVKLGDCFSTLPTNKPSNTPTLSRYRILHKLGHGSFATVWLARDLMPPGRFVALKISIADAPEASREVHVLKFISERNNDVASQHIMTLLDNFQVNGPNGSHEVIVTDVVTPLGALVQYPVYSKLRESFIRQALVGVSYLQQHGIAHGDLHLYNLGCTIPGLNENTEEDLLLHFVNPECIIVLTVDPSDQAASFPPYLVKAISMADYMVDAHSPSLPTIDAAPPSLKILDFGSAYQKDEPRPLMQCAVDVSPPEIVFPRVALGISDPDWDMRSDIWSLACTIYEMASGSNLFHGVSPVPRGGFLDRMAEMAGQLPPTWASFEDLRTQTISTATANDYWAARRPRLMRDCTSEEADRLIGLVRSMLVLDPAERPSALRLLEMHTWLENVSVKPTEG